MDSTSTYHHTHTTHRERTFLILPFLFQYLWPRCAFLLKAYHYVYYKGEKSNPCRYSPKSKAYHKVTPAELFKCQRCQLPIFTHPSFYREMVSSISLCCWRHLCLLSQTKHEKFWRTLNTTLHQLSKVFVTKTNTSSASAIWTFSEPHLYPVIPCY